MKQYIDQQVEAIGPELMEISQYIFQHPEVACSNRMRSKSVIAWGKVAYEEDFDKKVEALDIIMKQYSDKTFRYSDPAVRNVKIWTVDIDEVSCKEFGAPHKKSY